MDETSELVEAFVRARDILMAAAERVPPEDRQTPFVGHWNILDVLAHLVGWDYTNLQAIEDIKAGRLPDFYRQHDPGWASYNQQLIQRYGAGDWDALRGALKRSQEAVVARMRSLTPEELALELSEPGRRRPVSMAGILRAAVRDEMEHARQVREFVDSRRGSMG